MNNDNKPKNQVHEDEKPLLLDHDYDGIQELNHPLPTWWVWVWVLTLIHSAGYFAYYEIFKKPGLKEEFQAEYAKVQAAQEAMKLQHTKFDPERYTALNTPESMKQAGEVFEMNCVPCHAEKGKGDIGPNLTDNQWLVAKGNPETIYNVIFNGSIDNGMPEWGTVLTPEEIYLATAYVMSVKNTFVKGKPAEGTVIED